MVDDAHLDLLRGTIPKQPTYMVRNAKGRLAMQWNFWSLYKSLTGCVGGTGSEMRHTRRTLTQQVELFHLPEPSKIQRVPGPLLKAKKSNPEEDC